MSKLSCISPIDTTLWKEATVPELGIAFKYPNDLIFEFDKKYEIVSLKSPRTEREFELLEWHEFPSPRIIMGWEENPKNIPIEDYFDGDPGTDLFNEYSSGCEYVRVGNDIGCKVSEGLTNEIGYVYIIVTQQGKFLTIPIYYYFYDDTPFYHENGIADAIVASLKIN